MPQATLGQRIMRSGRERLETEYLKMKTKGIIDPVFVLDARGRDVPEPYEVTGELPVMNLTVIHCSRPQAVQIIAQMSKAASEAFSNDKDPTSTLNVVVLTPGKVEIFRETPPF